MHQHVTAHRLSDNEADAELVRDTARARLPVMLICPLRSNTLGSCETRWLRLAQGGVESGSCSTYGLPDSHAAFERDRPDHLEDGAPSVPVVVGSLVSKTPLIRRPSARRSWQKTYCQGRSKIRPRWRRKTRPPGRWAECLSAVVRTGWSGVWDRPWGGLRRSGNPCAQPRRRGGGGVRAPGRPRGGGPSCCVRGGSCRR